MGSILQVKHELCCGCAACSDRCGCGAVEMTEGKDGFQYPLINEKKCVNCGACLQVCPAERNLNIISGQKVYAARSKNSNVLSESSSGGVCFELGSYFVEKGGVVCGAAYTEGFWVQHIFVEKKENLRKLQGSKYVQSDCRNVYKKIKEFLKQGKKVLFTGTPCEVMAVKNYVGKDDENLYTIDLVCHGVPSRKMFQNYLEDLGRLHSGRVVDFKFRDKGKGWGTVGKAEIMSNGKNVSMPVYKTEASYYYYYLKGILSRESCYHCKFADANRVGDITCGDYWGIERVHPEIKHTESGISLLICNTEKGKKLIEQIKNIELIPSNLEQAKKYNGQLVKPQAYDKERERLMELYRMGGWEKIEETFRKEIGVRKYTDRIKAYVPKKLIRSFKKMRKC